MGESFYDAKPAQPRGGEQTQEAITDDDGTPLDENLTMAQVEARLAKVERQMESSVRQYSTMLKELVEKEDEWKGHQAIILMKIKARIEGAPKESRERSSEDMREAEVITSRSEEGALGRTLRKDYRYIEERCKQQDRYCRMLERRANVLQTLASNLRHAT